MDSISSANVACGFHAGDPGAMRATIALAREKGVAIGAHPGFQDLVGFGRREMKATPGGGRGPGALPGVGAGRNGVGAGRAASARQGARRALQHGVPRSRAGRCDRQGSGRVRSIADPVWPAELGVAARRRSRGLARRRGSVRRSCLRSGRIADVTDETRQRHSRHAEGRRARHQDGARQAGDRRRWIDDRAAGRHDVPARRYAGRGRSRQPLSERAWRPQASKSERLFIPHRVDRLERRGLHRRIQPEDQSHQERHDESERAPR